MQLPHKLGWISDDMNRMKRYKMAHYELLALTVFTVLNFIPVLFGSVATLLFTASVPRFLAEQTYLLIYYPTYLIEPAALAADGSLPVVLTVFCVAAAVLLTLFYFFAWLGSKKRGGWLIAACIALAADSVFLFFSVNDVFDIINIAFHLWFLFDLVSAVISWLLLRRDGNALVETYFFY